MSAGQWIRVGLLVRGQIRMALARAGIEYEEHKAPLESTFVLKCSPEVYQRVLRELKRHQQA